MLTLNGSGLLQQVLESAATGSTNCPPSNIAPPEFVGRTEVGATFSARPGLWAGSPSPEVQTTLLVGGVARRTPCLLGPEDDGLEVAVVEVASSTAGKAEVRSARSVVSYPTPHALSVPGNVAVEAGQTAEVDASAHFVGATGGEWAATCVEGADALRVEIDQTGRVVLDAAGQTGLFTIMASYANSGGSASASFTASFGDAEPIADPEVAAPEYDGSLGDLEIATGAWVEIEAGLAFSGINLVFSASGLPPGIAVDTETGLISGRPAQAARSSVTLVAANSAGSASAAFRLDVVDETQTLPQGPVYDGSLKAQQAVSGQSFDLSAGSAFVGEDLTFSAAGLPPGLGIDAATGAVSGTASASGDFTVMVKATNSGGAADATFLITVVEPALTAPTYDGTLQAAKAKVGAAFSLDAGSSFSGSSLVFSAAGLAPGLEIGATTGRITGIPSKSGAFTVAVTAKNPAGEARGSFEIDVAEANTVLISAPTYDGGAANLSLKPNVPMTPVDLSVHFTGADLVFSDDGTLPPKLSINPMTGVISGTPNTGDGTTTVVITARNAGGSAAARFNLILGTGTGTGLGTGTGTGDTSVAYTGGATDRTVVVDQAITPINTGAWFSNSPVGYTSTGLPTGLSIDAKTGIISGMPTVEERASVAVTATGPDGKAAAVAAFDINVQAAASKSISPSYTSTTNSTTSGTLVFDGAPGAQRFVMIIAGSRGMTDSGFAPASGARALVQRQSWPNRVVELWELTGSTGDSIDFTVSSSDSWILAFETVGYVPDTTDPLVVGRQDGNNASPTTVSATTKANGASVAFSKRYDSLATPGGTLTENSGGLNTGTAWDAVRVGVYETASQTSDDYTGTIDGGSPSMGAKYVAVALFEEKL